MRKNNLPKLSWTKGKKGSDDAFYIRTKVFMVEQGFTLEFDDWDKVSWQLTLYQGEEPIAAGRCYQNPDGSWQIGRICVLEEYRGKQIGSFVLHSIEEKILAEGGTEAQLSAQTRAQAFYAKQGYTAFGEEYLDETCPHIGMKKSLSPA